MILCDLLLRMREVFFSGGGVSADGKPKRDHTRILPVLAKYNITKINIGHQLYRWMD
jgi:hypothetical protein